MNANSSPTINTWLKQATSQLEDANISTARLDALVLLEDVLNKDRAHLLAHPELELTSEQQNVLNAQILRRVNHEPLAFIRGKTEFYGREFIISDAVLEPRPETETMIDLLKKLPTKDLKTPKIADIGTGSGAIAITAQLEIPTAQVTAVDIDPRCLKVAEINRKKHGATVTFFKGDLLEPIKAADILLCNLPYVPDDFNINRAALHEPRIAIFGGSDGLDLYRTLFKQISERDQKPRFILTESLPFQHHTLAELARKHGYVLVESADFIQVFER